MDRGSRTRFVSMLSFLLAMGSLPAVASEPHYLGEQQLQGKLRGQLTLFPEELPKQPGLKLDVLELSPGLMEQLFGNLIDVVERAKLTGQLSPSPKMGSGRTGGSCLVSIGPLIFCVGGNELRYAEWGVFQAKVGTGAYFKKDFGKSAPTLVIGPEVRVAVGVNQFVPQTLSFVEGGIGISAF